MHPHTERPQFASGTRATPLQRGTAAAQAPGPRPTSGMLGMRRGLLGQGGGSGSTDGPHSPRSPASITMLSNPWFDEAGGAACAAGAGTDSTTGGAAARD